MGASTERIEIDVSHSRRDPLAPLHYCGAGILRIKPGADYSRARRLLTFCACTPVFSLAFPASSLALLPGRALSLVLFQFSDQ